MPHDGRRPLRSSLFFTGFFAISSLAAAPDPGAAQLSAAPVSGQVHVLQGPGGNIALNIGADGVLMVDTQFAPLADEIEAKIHELGGTRPAFVINTHWHADHSGGNERFTGTAVLIAHDNVFKRLADPAADRVPAALPTLTYQQSMTLHYNGEDIRLLHLAASHTDGDTAVWFTGSNVVHLGDTYINRAFPFVDTENGGTLEGLLRNADEVLALLPDDVTIIPGHGPVSNKADFQSWVADVRESIDFVRGEQAAGKDLQSIIDTGLPAKYASWSERFVKEPTWITTIYNSPTP
ncbi:MAG TPA: MBL fold metallo-hydrolase [Hyphomicrobiales bacterium]|nr:MBL fold metallo-hydrolase [Hyphomicrobiales bacterium]